MSGWDGVRERVLALGPRQKERGLRGLRRRSAVPSAPLLDDPLTEEQVASAERQFGVVFPAGYRGFLLEVGAGGIGPGYGLTRLTCQDGTWGWPDRALAASPVGPLLSRPFPSDEQRARWTEQLSALEDAAVAAFEEDEPATHPAVSALRAAEEELYPAMTAGAIRLSHEGCGYFTWLVVTGEERGTLWFDARVSDGPLVPLWHAHRRRTGFAEWYLEWLDEAAAGPNRARRS